MEFKVGDRVRVVENEIYPWLEGKAATVVMLPANNFHSSVGVRFDLPFPEGHDLDGHCKDGYGWYLSPKILERCLNNKAEDLLKMFEEGENCGSV